MKAMLDAVYSISPELDMNKDGQISREELLIAFRKSISSIGKRKKKGLIDYAVNLSKLKDHEVMSIEEINEYKTNIPRLARTH